MVDTDWIYWTLFLAGYAVCSGANVAYFVCSRRDLRRAMERGREAGVNSVESRDARRAASLLRHIEQPNWTLAAILLTNVGFGVQISQLSDRLFPGVLGLVMPIISITIVGEFFAQATFLRYSSSLCAFFSPLVWLLKYVTGPISWPLARAVDKLYGVEALRRLSEQDLISDLQLELNEFGTGETKPHEDHLDTRELKTLMNAARADDELARKVGEVLSPSTIISLPFESGLPSFPADSVEFVRTHIDASPHPWFVIVNSETGQPQRVLDADGFVRLFFQCLRTNTPNQFAPHTHTYRAQVYRNSETKLGEVVSDFLVNQEHPGDDVIDVDVALIWTTGGCWIVTGGDVLGRLLRGVARQKRGKLVRDRLRHSHEKTPESEA